MMTSICKEYWQFVLAQGILCGIGMSMLQVSAFAAVSQYFQRKRAAALGIVVSGSSIGGIVFPIALSKMLNDSPLSFGWSVRIMAFIVMPFLLFAAATVVPRLPPRQTQFWIKDAFKEVKYLLVIFCFFLTVIGMLFPSFYLPTYAVSTGMNPTLASYLLAILNAASTFGRIIPGIIADKYGRLNVFGLGGLMTGILVLIMTTVKSTAALVLYAVAFAFFSGTIISGASAAFSVCTDNLQNLGTYMGMGMALASTSSLVGPPVDGALFDRYGAFLEPSIFSGVICIIGGLLVFVTKMTTPQGLRWGRCRLLAGRLNLWLSCGTVLERGRVVR